MLHQNRTTGAGNAHVSEPIRNILNAAAQPALPPPATPKAGGRKPRKPKPSLQAVAILTGQKSGHSFLEHHGSLRTEAGPVDVMLDLDIPSGPCVVWNVDAKPADLVKLAYELGRCSAMLDTARR